jgi:hypothetical protein
MTIQLSLTIVQTEHVVLHIEVASSGKQLEHLGELEGVLVGAGAEGSGDEDEHAALRPRRLAVDGVDVVVALREGEGAELAGDGGGAEKLLALEGEHGPVLVQRHQRRPVRVERPVVVLHERLRHRVRVHGVSPLSLA